MLLVKLPLSAGSGSKTIFMNTGRNTGRDEDIKELYRQLDRTDRPEARRDIMRTIQIIKNESGSIRSMREALLKAHRNQDVEEIKDIHSFISSKQKYGQ